MLSQSLLVYKSASPRLAGRYLCREIKPTQAGAYPEPNTGVFHVTGQPSDMGKFKVPTLRNVALTAPYFHDGSAATLDDVLDHYQAGGRTITSGPYAGNGNLSPLKDPLIQPRQMSAQDRADVIAFLQSLSDDAFLTNPALANPW